MSDTTVPTPAPEPTPAAVPAEAVVPDTAPEPTQVAVPAEADVPDAATEPAQAVVPNQAAAPDPATAPQPVPPQPGLPPVPVAPAFAPDAAAEPQLPAAEVTAPKPAQRKALRAGAAVLAAALLGVGIGEVILRTAYPDHGAPANAAAESGPLPGASASPAFGAHSDGTHFGPMRQLLLPVPSGYALGPDSGAYGNDTELTDEQRQSWVDDEVHGLPSKLQDGIRKGWQDVKLRGAGVRSYRSLNQDLVITVWLLQYHEDAVKADNAWSQALSSDSGLFRLGPQVPGHDEAHCFLPATDPGDPIDDLDCSAAEGDLRVVLKVEGIAPLPKDKAVAIFTQQLERLAIPGASV